MNAGCFTATDHSVSVCNNGARPESALEDDDTLEATATINQITLENFLPNDAPLVAEAETVGDGPASETDGYALMDEMVKKWTLNAEQKRAFEIVV